MDNKEKENMSKPDGGRKKSRGNRRRNQSAPYMNGSQGWIPPACGYPFQQWGGPMMQPMMPSMFSGGGGMMYPGDMMSLQLQLQAMQAMQAGAQALPGSAQSPLLQSALQQQLTAIPGQLAFPGSIQSTLLQSTLQPQQTAVSGQLALSRSVQPAPLQSTLQPQQTAVSGQLALSGSVQPAPLQSTLQPQQTAVSGQLALSGSVQPAPLQSALQPQQSVLSGTLPVSAQSSLLQSAPQQKQATSSGQQAKPKEVSAALGKAPTTSDDAPSAQSTYRAPSRRKQVSPALGRASDQVTVQSEDENDADNPPESSDQDQGSDVELVMIEGDSSKCGIYLPGKSVPDDVSVEQPPKKKNTRSQQSGGKKDSKVHPSTIDKVQKAAEDYFKTSQSRLKTGQLKTRSATALQKSNNKKKKNDLKLDDFSDDDDESWTRLDQLESRVCRSVTSAYARARTTYDDDEDMKALKKAGVLLPNGFKPMEPFYDVDGEDFIGD